MEACLLEVSDDGILHCSAVEYRDGVVGTVVISLVESERHVAEHHHEVMVSHSAETFCLAEPLHDVGVFLIIDRRMLQIVYKLVCLFDERVSGSPE